jgi:hypothetical protein
LSLQDFHLELGSAIFKRMEPIISASGASAGFKEELRTFVAGGQVEAVVVQGFAPRVKVERVLVQLLTAEPELPIEKVVVKGRSGCSDFSGQVTVHTGSEARVYEFTWCCRWRAEQEGWVDYFGFPDQQRAAREYGWQCFETWKLAAQMEATPAGTQQ